MSSCSQFSFGTKPVSCHAYNADESKVAVSLNDEKVIIFKKVGAKWEKESELIEHSGKVTGIDWAPQSNKIVSCSSDRNAFVWQLNEKGVWKPELVVLRINRGAICVKWSPLENKFAVGTGSRVIAICYYDDDNKWWASKSIKKPIRSSVLSLSWHPNNYLIAAGTSDHKCRVFSAYLKQIESRPSANEWGSRLPFGELLAEYGSSNGGWVHDVAFNTDGTSVAWVSHNSSVGYAQAGGSSFSTLTSYLPFSGCHWTSPNTLVAVGFDCKPFIFQLGANGFTYVDTCDKADTGSGVINSSRNMWQQMDNKGTTESTTQLKSRHKNSILEVRPCRSGFSTCAADGQIIQWNFGQLCKQFSGLKI